jgi:hypothetical protein
MGGGGRRGVKGKGIINFQARGGGGGVNEWPTMGGG